VSSNGACRLQPLALKNAFDGLNVYQFEQVWEDCEVFVDRSAVVPPELTRDDALAIVLYTYEIQEPGHEQANIYSRLNKCLRERGPEVYKWKHYLYVSWLPLPLCHFVLTTSAGGISSRPCASCRHLKVLYSVALTNKSMSVPLPLFSLSSGTDI